MAETHPLTRMTSGSEVERMLARVDYGVLSEAEALAHPFLTPSERKELARRLGAVLAEDATDDATDDAA